MMGGMSPSSSMPTLLLLRTERKPGVLLFAATWLWTRQNTAALADLRATLDIDAADTVSDYTTVRATIMADVADTN